MDDFSNPCSKVFQRAYLENWKCLNGKRDNYRDKIFLSADNFPSALGSMNIHLDSAKYKDKLEADYEPMTVQEANQVFVTRNTVSKLHLMNNFDSILPGCFVRIPQHPDREDVELTSEFYRITRVASAEATVKPYYYGAVSFFKTLRVDLIGYERSNFPITCISNSGILQHEFDEYAKALKEAGRRLPSKKTILSKAKELSAFLVAMLRTRVYEKPGSCDYDDGRSIDSSSRTDESSREFEVAIIDDLASSDSTRSPSPLCRLNSSSECSAEIMTDCNRHFSAEKSI